MAVVEIRYSAMWAALVALGDFETDRVKVIEGRATFTAVTGQFQGVALYRGGTRRFENLNTTLTSMAGDTVEIIIDG